MATGFWGFNRFQSLEKAAWLLGPCLVPKSEEARDRAEVALVRRRALCTFAHQEFNPGTLIRRARSFEHCATDKGCPLLLVLAWPPEKLTAAWKGLQVAVKCIRYQDWIKIPGQV